LSQPEYAEQLRQRGDQGIVGIDVYVLENGRVGDVRVGVSSGHDELDAATLKEARFWRFAPGTVNGKRAAMWAAFSITFSVYDKNRPMPNQSQALSAWKSKTDERRAQMERLAAEEHAAK
jgi:TonB family protein